ncbi:hypothetical protein OG618_11260 [Kitasatospora sp. NBC_01246]|uniref:hypothetical protein n=1 Tax=Kitasatospora sp. NBC_01246 TaxID=2903570 RepID=UPI002E33332D|nr:hypothetical protein [Kitasatospora sp. NBC_01246]
MPGLQRAVLLRAAAAVLALSAAVGADTAVGHALARRGAERAERDAYVCAEAARVDAVARATRSAHESRPDLYDPGRPPGCDPNGR